MARCSASRSGNRRIAVGSASIRLWACLVCVGTCLVGPAAYAHALLERAIPAVGSEVAQAPANLQLRFTEGVEPAFSTVAITDTSGNRVDQAGLTVQQDGRLLVVPLKALRPGVYAVEWHVTSVDTHKTQGHFSFTVTQGASAPK